MVGALSSQVKVEGAVAPDPRLRKSAQEFESMLLADMLKLGTEESRPEGELDQGCQQGYEDLRNQAVARALAESGGVGIGRMLIQHLGPGAEH